MNGVNFTGANKLLPKLTKSLVNGLVINFVISIKQNLYFVNLIRMVKIAELFVIEF